MAVMPDIAREAAEAVFGHRHDHPAPGVTVTATVTTTNREDPPVTTTAANVAPVAPAITRVHHALDTAGRILSDAFRTTEAIASDQRLVALVEAGLDAAGLGVGEEAFAAAVDVLQAAGRRKNAAQAPPATGPQQVIA